MTINLFFSTVFALIQGIILIIIAPGITGLLRYSKAGLQQRRRPLVNIWQPYRDLHKLFKTPAVRSETTSWLFALTPAILFVAYGWLIFLTPLFGRTTVIKADFITVMYVLALARFMFSLAGLDSGSSFGGLGGSREMFFHFLTEIGLFLLITALALNWGTVSLSSLFEQHNALGIEFYTHSELLLLALSFAGLILFETGRIPIDNPATHLELTMGQKAITLEYAGRDLALIEWAEMIKFTFLIALFSNLFLPLPLPVRLVNDVLLNSYAIVKFFVLVFALALWEMHRPKLRLGRTTKVALFAIALSLISIIQIIVVPRSG